MTLSSTAKTGLVRLWKFSMIAIRYALVKPTG